MKLSYLSALAFVPLVLCQSGTVLHPNTATNKCVEIRGDVRENGTAVQIFDCNGTPAQQWVLNLGLTTVRLANSTFCLDSSHSPTDGTPMKIWQCIDNLPAQQWFLTTDARIALFGAGLCLDLPNGSLLNANQLQTWKCTDGNTNQIWRNF